MNKKLYILPLLLFWSHLSYGQLTKECKETVRAIIARTVEQSDLPIVLESIPKQNGCDAFEQTVSNGKLIIKGSSGVALSRGFYDFIRQNEIGQVAWSGKRCDWPSSLNGLKTRKVVSPVQHHYYYNVVTFGYSTPYWDWDRWEEEIDWMALHGIDMPLALVANEAISVRVWKKLGLTDKEIADYLVGPAHFPWMRMGNISGIDSPLPQSWHKEQIELQHKILQRMRILGMKPICPGFAGFVPQAIKRVLPDVNLIETSWNVFHNWMISPQNKHFSEIGKLFIEEWEKEFGKGEYYIADSFNEMDIPFPPKGSNERYELLASYGDKVYQSIKAGNPNAVWVMQGWMFGYQRHIWDYETLKALVSKVPDDKIVLLDLAADYNANFWKNSFNWDFYKGFFNKQWVYSVIPNMGGKSGFTGILDFYANGHLNALESTNRGNLFAIGMAPEGIENNEVIYELLTDAGWNSQKIDISKWLESYTQARYGTYNTSLANYWQHLLQSVYGSFTDHPRFNWQFRPGTVQKGSINMNDSFFKAIESFAACAPEMKGNVLYETDLRENTAMYLGGKAEYLVRAIQQAHLNNDLDKVQQLASEFEQILLGIDQLLEKHPTLSLSRWIGFARKHGQTPVEKDYYERNARRIVTVWGPPVDDYSARIWAGLIRSYYVPRWNQYFKSLVENKPYDIKDWEINWVEKEQGVPAIPISQESLEATVANWISSTSHITQGMVKEETNPFMVWSDKNFTGKKCSLNLYLPVNKMHSLSSIRFLHLTGKEGISVKKVVIRMDGKTVEELNPNVSVNHKQKEHVLPVSLNKDLQGNNGCEIQIYLEKQTETASTGKVLLTF